MAHKGGGADRKLTDGLEETLIAVFLGLMTVITFANVVARYIFNENILWALEATVYLFAWLVLLGAAYAVKTTAHLGVDIVVQWVPKAARRVLGLIAVSCCILYAALMLKGGWDYWANFAGLPQTTGRWFPTGLEDKFLSKTWYEVNDIEMPAFMQFLADWMNDGEEYEKIPRWIPYTIMPLSMALLLLRFVQAAVRIATGEREMLIASHEVEDEIDDAAARAAGEEKG